LTTTNKYQINKDQQISTNRQRPTNIYQNKPVPNQQISTDMDKILEISININKNKQRPNQCISTDINKYQEVSTKQTNTKTTNINRYQSISTKHNE